MSRFLRRIGRTKGGLNSKLHAVCEGAGRPLVMLLSEGQMSDYKGAALMLPALPKAKELLADRGCHPPMLKLAIAAMLTMSESFAPRDTICTGFSRPTIKGPITVAPPNSCSMRVEIEAE